MFLVDILTWSKTSLFAVIKLRLQVFTADSLNIISFQFRDPLVCISTLRYNKDVRGEKSWTLSFHRGLPKYNHFRLTSFFRRHFNIWILGCHCWTKPNTENIGYKGQPLDGVDRACRTLHSCHTCINLDFQNCDPVTTKYRAKVVKNGDGTIDIQCSKYLNQFLGFHFRWSKLRNLCHISYFDSAFFKLSKIKLI